MTCCPRCGIAIDGWGDPTPAEHRVLQAIVEFHDARGRFPTYREIQRSQGYRSVQSVHAKVHALAEKGLLVMGDNKRIRSARRPA